MHASCGKTACGHPTAIRTFFIPQRNPFLLFLRQDLQVQVQAHLTALSVLTSIFVRQMQVPFLDHFWSLFEGRFGVTFEVETESKIGPFFGQPPDGHLEATWEVSWLSWGSLGRPGVPDLLQKTIQNSNFQNRFFSPSWLLPMAFGCHVGSFWGGFGPQNGPQTPPTTGPKICTKNNIFLIFFGQFLGPKMTSKNQQGDLAPSFSRI